MAGRESLLDRRAERVIRDQVYFLNTLRYPNGRRQQYVARRRHLPRGSRQSHRHQTALTRARQRLQDVDGRAARRNAERYVTRNPERFDLTREHIIKRLIVAPGREDGLIRRQRNRRQCGTIDVESSDEFTDKMLRVGRRSAVTESKQLAAGRECPVDHVNRGADGLRIGARRNGRHVVRGLAKEICEPIHHRVACTTASAVVSAAPVFERKNSSMISRRFASESQLFTRTRKCDPQSNPFEYQLHSARILLITHRSRPRANTGTTA